MIVAGLLICILLTRGFGFLERFMTVPSLKAKSGIKYTPRGAMERYLEKRKEEDE